MAKRVWLMVTLACLGLSVLGDAPPAEQAVSRLLAADTPPPGVVFEVVAGQEAALRGIVPRLKGHVRRLRRHFPGLEIAIVSHGAEQFALQRSRRDRYPQLHRDVESLVDDGGVAVHVCGTHASWRGVAPEAFPGYVNVAAAGPAQIHDYEALGYVRILVR